MPRASATTWDVSATAGVRTLSSSHWRAVGTGQRCTASGQPCVGAATPTDHTSPAAIPLRRPSPALAWDGRGETR